MLTRCLQALCAKTQHPVERRVSPHLSPAYLVKPLPFSQASIPTGAILCPLWENSKTCVFVFCFFKDGSSGVVLWFRKRKGNNVWMAMAYSSYSSLSRAQLTFEYLHTNSWVAPCWCLSCAYELDIVISNVTNHQLHIEHINSAHSWKYICKAQRGLGSWPHLNIAAFWYICTPYRNAVEILFGYCRNAQMTPWCCLTEHLSPCMNG